VRREDLDVIRQPEEGAVETVVELLRLRDLDALAEQVRPPHAPREERVAGEHEPGLLGARPVRDQERGAVRRVAGRVEHGDLDVAQLERLAVGHADVRDDDRRRPVEEHGRPGEGREPARAGDVIRLDVGLEDVGDAQGLLRGRVDIGLDLMLWIHHSAGAHAPSAEEIAGAAGRGVEEMAEDHGSPPSPVGAFFR
jgi:hypothetical protein